MNIKRKSGGGRVGQNEHTMLSIKHLTNTMNTDDLCCWLLFSTLLGSGDCCDLWHFKHECCQQWSCINRFPVSFIGQIILI